MNVKKTVRIDETRGTVSGSNLSELSAEDKIKISKLVEKVLELGRENEALKNNMQALQQRREEDVTTAIAMIRTELLRKSEEVEDLQSKRLGALELLHRYQIKISDLVVNVRALERRDSESKAQMTSYKTELNNMQQLLETQSQTIQSYRVQMSTATTKESSHVELLEALRKRANELKQAESRATELEANIQQLHEQLANLRSVVHDKDKQLVELNDIILRQDVQLSPAKAPDRPIGSRPTDNSDRHSGGPTAAPWPSIVQPAEQQPLKKPEQHNLSPYHSYSSVTAVDSPPTPREEEQPSWGSNLKDEDFISHLERLAKEKKLRKEKEAAAEEAAFNESMVAPPPLVHSPPTVSGHTWHLDPIEGQTDNVRKPDNDPVPFDDSYSTIESNSGRDSRPKRPKSPTRTPSAKRKSSKPAGLQHKGQSPYLSSSSSTFLKTVARSGQRTVRHSYSGKSSMLNQDDTTDASEDRKVKFGVKISNGTKVKRSSDEPLKSNGRCSKSRDDGLRHNSTPMSPSSMYDDPVLFNLLDELDSHDNSTISSISKHYDENQW